MNQRVRGILIDSGKVALIQRVKGDRTYYIFPGGGVEEGESFSEALHREIKEELGIEIKIGKLYAEHQYKSQSGEDMVHYFYICEQTGGEFGTGDGPEYQPGSEYEAEGTHDPIWVPLLDLHAITLYPVVIKESIIKKYC